MEENSNGVTFLEEQTDCEVVMQENLDSYQEISKENNNSKSEMLSDYTQQENMYLQFDVPCPVCGLEFDNCESTLNHLDTHTENENLLLTCNLCNVICLSLKQLQDHIKEHLNEIKPNVNKCSHCKKLLSTEEELGDHEKQCRENDGQVKKATEMNYLCNICGKILKTKDRFRSHKNTHDGIRPHICLKCGRGFADRKNMHHHYNVIHLKKPKLECPVCQKKFYTRTKMKSHITMHYGVKPFSCDVCNKTFRLKMNMIKHKKTHSNDRPHKCDKCQAAFIDKNMLKRHSYIHGGIRPFPCPICGHRFSVKFHLKKHLEKGKCCSKNAVTTITGTPDNYQWAEEFQQPEVNFAGNECLIVYKASDGIVEQNSESIAVDILQQYPQNTNSQ